MAVRIGKWKAVRKGLKKNPDAAIELFDLENDISEQNNLAESFPEIVSVMKEFMRTAHTPSEYFPFPALDSLQYLHR